MRLARLEYLMDRRPLLLNRVLLRQNPHNVQEWLKRVKLYEEKPKEVSLTKLPLFLKKIFFKNFLSFFYKPFYFKNRHFVVLDLSCGLRAFKSGQIWHHFFNFEGIT